MCQAAVATTSDHISVYEEVTEVNSFRHIYRRYLVITRRESFTLFLATLFKKKQLLLLRTNRGLRETRIPNVLDQNQENNYDDSHLAHRQ